LAINEQYKTKDGEKKEVATFVDCTAWQRKGEAISQYLHKGDPILIEGKLRLEQWEAQDGSNRSKLTVTVDQFSFIGGGKGESRSESSPKSSSGAPDGGHQPITEDEIPF